MKQAKFEFSEKSDISDGELTGKLFKLESLVKNENDSYLTSSSSVIPEMSYPVIGKFTGIFAKLNSMSVNKRFYSKLFWEKMLDSEQVHADLASGKMQGIFEHPNVMENYTKEGVATARHPMNSAFVVKKLWIEDNEVMGEAYLLNTPLGKLLATYFLAQDDRGQQLIQLFISARGYTEKDYFDANGIDIMNPNDYFLQSFDIVMNPGIKGARVKMESDSSNSVLGELDSFSKQVKSLQLRNDSIRISLRSELNLKNV